MNVLGWLKKREVKAACEQCGDEFTVLARAPRPYVCSRCRTRDRAQEEIHLWMGEEVRLSPLPTLRGNVRVVRPFAPVPDLGTGEHACPYCGSQLWRQVLVTLRSMEATTDDSQLLLPHGPGAELEHDECPHPECPAGWSSVRDGSRDAKGFTPEMTPPWAGDQEHHERWWAAYRAGLNPQAGKGVGVVGMFGGEPGH